MHLHWRRVNELRAKMNLAPLEYRYAVERHPRLRDAILSMWVRRHKRTVRRLNAMPSAPPSVTTIIARVFGSAAPAAISVASCESGLNPLAHNPSGAAGLFQLMPVHWEAQGYDPYDAGTNTRIAYHLYTNSGWSAWVCQP